MQIKRIQCPNCKVVLDVKNSQNEAVKQITCPKCKTILQVKFPPQQEPLIARTYYAPPKKSILDNGSTQLTLNSSKSGMNAKLIFGKDCYPLEDGQNIVGRKGKTSVATVQIDTDDRYMSRQHCSITVNVLPDGTRKVVLSNFQNKNLTSVNGQDIETGDTIRLADGNSITMGYTTVTFKLSES